MGIQISPPKMIILNNDRMDTYVTRIRDEINPSVGATYFHNMFPAGVGAGFLFVLAGFATIYFWIRSKVSSNNRSAYVLRDLGQN